MYKNTITLEKDHEVRTILNPYVRRILHLMRENIDPMTVKQIADALGEVHGKVYYHVQKLYKLNLLDIVRTESINGIIAKYYKRKYDAIYYSSEYINLQTIEESSNIFVTTAQNYTNDIHLNKTMFGGSNIPLDHATVSKYHLYLTQEEYQKVKNYIIYILRKKSIKRLRTIYTHFMKTIVSLKKIKMDIHFYSHLQESNN